MLDSLYNSVMSIPEKEFKIVLSTVVSPAVRAAYLAAKGYAGAKDSAPYRSLVISYRADSLSPNQQHMVWGLGFRV